VHPLTASFFLLLGPEDDKVTYAPVASEKPCSCSEPGVTGLAFAIASHPLGDHYFIAVLSLTKVHALYHSESESIAIGKGNIAASNFRRSAQMQRTNTLSLKSIAQSER